MIKEDRIHQVSDRTTGRAWLILATERTEAEVKWHQWMAEHGIPLPPEPEWYLVYGTVIQ